MAEKKSGTYLIEICGNSYYGSSVDLIGRMKNHLSKLKSGKHRNSRLQRCYDKYGEHNFKFTILKECSSCEILIEEQMLLDAHHGNSNCLNFCKSAHSPMLGVKFKESHKQRIRNSNRSYTYTIKVKNKVLEFDSLRSLCLNFNIKRTIISRWLKRGSISAKTCIARKIGITYIKRESIKTGDTLVIETKEIPNKTPIWVLKGFTSKTGYYRKIKKQCTQEKVNPV